MSTSVTGRLVDAGADPLPGLVVLVRDESALFASDLGHGTSQADGTFTISYGTDLTPELGTRKLGIYVFTSMHRQLAFQAQDDVTDPQLALGDIQIAHNEATGWTVTLGGSAAALPVTDGNAVLPLIDDQDAWGHLTTSLTGASTTIDVMQLEFDMPAAYNSAPDQESPEIVMSFASPVDPVTPRPVTGPTDYRPERIMLDKASQGVKVNIIMPTVQVNWLIAAVDFVIMLIPFLLLVIFDVGKSWKLIAGLFASKPGGGFSDVRNYFQAAGSTTDVEQFSVTMFNRVHAKVVIIDDTEAIVLGSPFSQSYWDTHDHHVIEPRRGSACGEPIPVHDVSVAVRGPAVKDIHDAFRLHWNLGKAPDAQIAAITAAAPITTANAGESIASLQLVRTLNGGVFTDQVNGQPNPLANGEEGVLEAYLRAIENAQNYIYLENQYFTNQTIGKALVAALNDTTRPGLNIIVLLNVTPDLPFYPVWQSNLIARIRKDAGNNASRIGFFTAWTHDPPWANPQPTGFQQAKPMIAANYVHTKVAIVDGSWATIGSANLDGASLDFVEFLHPFQFGSNKNHELNYSIFNGIDGHPSSDIDGHPSGAVDNLRLALWSEHLGIDPADPRLAANQANNTSWLSLWQAQATAKCTALQNSPATINPANGRVLAYPPNTLAGVALLLPWKNPEQDFLTASQINVSNFDLIEQMPAFSFHDGKWK